MMYPHVIAKSWFIKASLVALAMLAASPALAHQASISHATADINRSQTEVTYRIKFSPADLSEALGLGEDVTPPDQAVAAGQERLLDYVLAHVQVTDRKAAQGGQTCPVERLGARVIEQGGRFVEVSFRVRCPEPLTALVVEYDLFFDIDPLHRGLLQVTYRGEHALAELKPGADRFVWDLEKPPPSSTPGFIITGIEHIIFGFDHIAFLIGLLLVVVILRPSPRATRWQLQDLGAGLRSTAGIVTAFTVAHSLTLVAASLSWVSLSGRLVESLIAASIVYVAAENLVTSAPRRRYLLTFVFGLVHGLGFASVLKVLLPPTDVLGPLVMFNVGVELGQLAIVMVMLPLLHLAARVAGAERYRRMLMPAASGVLALLGLAWLVERAFGVVIIGF